MQEGIQTVGDGMRRHLVTLERERRNLEESLRLCRLLQEREEPLGQLDPESVLEEMARLEESGASFQDTRRQDVRMRYVAPIAVSAALVTLMAALMTLFIWAFLTDPERSPPLALVLVLMAVPALVIAGVLLALGQRIEEIGKGEADDAKQY